MALGLRKVEGLNQKHGTRKLQKSRPENLYQIPKIRPCHGPQ